MNRIPTVFLLSILVIANATAAWLTFGGDPQRTGLAENETHLTKSNIRTLRLKWKLHLENVQKEMTSLTAPVIADSLTTLQGVKDIVVIAGSSDNVFGIDADAGILLWKRNFPVTATPRRPSTVYCPNNLNATPVLYKRGWRATAYLIASDGKLHSLNVVTGDENSTAIEFLPAFSKPWSLNLFDQVLYTPVSQGCNYTHNGVYALDLGQATHTPVFFQDSRSGGGIWGRAGVAIDTDGRVYATTGDGISNGDQAQYANSVIALAPKTLKLVDYYTAPNSEWLNRRDLDMGSISPVVFPFESYRLIASGGKEGVLVLLDSKSLGGPDHKTALYRSPIFANGEVDDSGKGFWGALSTWQDPQGTRWLYTPSWGEQAKNSSAFPITYGPTPGGSVMAFKVVIKNGKPVLEPAWRSRNMTVPEPVLIANGMVFGLSNGENVEQTKASGELLTGKERASAPAGSAVLYALDAQTGKELYSSGQSIPSWVHMSGLAISYGRIYVVTYNSDLYCFTSTSD